LNRAGRRYRLVLYTHILNRWWPELLGLGAALVAVAWGLRRSGWPDRSWQAVAGASTIAVAGSAFLLLIRKAAYVQPHADHLFLVTPFLRLRVSYRRIRRASSATIQGLFPPQSRTGRSKSILRSLSRMTAVVLELHSYPLPRPVLQLFLSPLFFKDRTPQLVLLVHDWMQFSSELESFRGAGAGRAAQQRLGGGPGRFG
jgi:hypothetical protein